MAVRPLPPQEQLHKLFDYDAETGALYWRASRRNGLTGREAGCVIGKRRYRSIVINGSAYQAHRLAWMWCRGYDPGEVLDHINGNTFDNRIANLRPASTAQNGWNRGRPITNSSGYKGVCWHSRDNRWVAYIKTNGVRRHLGNFDTPEAAHSAYEQAASTQHGEFARAA